MLCVSCVLCTQAYDTSKTMNLIGFISQAKYHHTFPLIPTTQTYTHIQCTIQSHPPSLPPPPHLHTLSLCHPTLPTPSTSALYHHTLPSPSTPALYHHTLPSPSTSLPRSATLVIAYLMRHEGKSLSRRETSLYPPQLRFLEATHWDTSSMSARHLVPPLYIPHTSPSYTFS